MHVRLPVIAFIASLWPCTTVVGQQVPQAIGAVEVTPDGESTPTYQANTGGYSKLFWVKNNETATMTYQITCVGRLNVTCTGTDVSQVILAAGAQIDVMASFSVGAAAFKPGRLVLEASGAAFDTGYVFVQVANPVAPTVALRNHNGDNRDRSLCLTAGAGEAAAWQCGDLLVTHGLPGYATMGRERTLTLLYNSAQAVPKPVITAAVTQGEVAPAAVFVRLLINGVPRDSASWAGWAGTRQIALAYDALPDSSGIYPFTLMVRSVFAGSAPETTVSDTLIVVNRAASLYGTGWTLAGVEELRLNQPGNKVLWVGGDGSAKVYRNVGTDTFVGAAGGFRDTLTRFDSAGVSWWRRRLRHGVAVTYSDTGTTGRAKHVRTTNRAGQTTVFAWSKDTLKSITVPPGISGTTYTLTYANGRLDRITDPAGRVLDVTVVSNRLTKIIDPDTTAYHTDFAYDAAGRMTGRTTRRGYTTSFVYAKGLRVDAVKVPLNPASGDTASTTFAPWDEQGLATEPTGQTAVDTAVAITTIFGPRVGVADDASFWVDRWSAAVKIRDPLGFETTLRRGDLINPALVTRAQFPNGRVVGAGYNERGNLILVADSTYEGTGTVQTVVTSYVYGNLAVPDAPTEMRTPVDTIQFRYDTTLGVPDTAIAPGGHRTRFEYYTTAEKRGLLYRVTELGVPVVDTVLWTKAAENLVTTFAYDMWGNDSVVTSPKGSRVVYGRDAFRRVSSVTDPGLHRTDFTYSPLNDVRTETVSDGGSLTTQYFYSPTSTLDSVLDARQVRRSWEVDAAERPVQLKDEAEAVEQRFFNRAGLLDSVRTRNTHVIRHRYSVAGQPTATIYPTLVYGAGGFPSGDWGPDTIPGDSIARTYDAMGRLLSISRSNSTITRTYYREGTLRTERQILRDGLGGVMSDVTLEYWYDKGSRRMTFFNGIDTLRYVYGPNGLLSSLAVRWGTGQAPDTFRFYWDGLGRRDSIAYSMGTFVSFGYDKDRILRMVCARHPGNPTASDYLEHRLWYAELDADGMATELSRWAGGTTSPSCQNVPLSAQQVELGVYEYDARHQVRQDMTYRYDYDGSGNRVAKRTHSLELVDSLTYQSGQNRVFEGFGADRQLNKTYGYNGDGARYRETSLAWMHRLYYYSSLGEMTGHRWVYSATLNPVTLHYDLVWAGSAQNCRYDVLGRRTNTCGAVPGSLAFDGDNVVRFGSSNPTWRYVHGPALDDPLVAMHQVGADYRKHFYLTDGRGRHLAFTDSIGANLMDPSQSSDYRDGGNQAGAIENSHTFEHERGGSAGTPQLSYYRNRFYDQKTGQFIQEDPIGIAGGVNLYQYAGNNPVNYSDPFGLCLPPFTPLCLVAIAIPLAATVFGGSRIVYNAATDRPLDEGVQSDVARGSVVGLGAGTLAAASGLGTAVAADATATTTAVGGTAGALGSRADALARLRELGPEAVNGLREFFKTGKVPAGLSPDALQRYRAVADQTVRAGMDKLGVQAERIKMIDDVLNKNQQ